MVAGPETTDKFAGSPEEDAGTEIETVALLENVWVEIGVKLLTALLAFAIVSVAMSLPV